MRSNLAEIEVEIHHETEKAWLVSTNGERKNAVWVPKSQGEIDKHNHRPGCFYILVAPEPLLIEKGLV